MCYPTKLIRTLFAILLISGTARSGELSQEIGHLMETYMEQDLFSGVVLVGEGEEIRYERTFGKANKDFNVDNTPETKFNIASIGKTLTAVAIMRLVEQEKIALDDSITQYIPDWPHEQIPQIRHLLSHTGGLGNYMRHPEFDAKKNTLRSLNALLALIYEEPLRFQPGTRFMYSNSGYILLGLVIEKVTGMRYTEYVQENIFAPAGLEHTGWYFPEEVVPNRATGYIKGIDGGFMNNSQVNLPAYSDGGTLTTAGDLFRYHVALSNEKLLSQCSKDEMFTPFFPDGNYGLGWMVDSLAGELMIGHTGGAPGVNAEFYRFPNAKNCVVIVLSNYSHASPGVGRKISALLFDKPYEMPKPNLGEFLYTQIQTHGISHVTENLQQILKEGGYSIESDRELNILGYQLMARNEVSSAIAIFQLNIQLFPEKANTFDSLGEAYLTAGDTLNAIKNYQETLRLNPDNLNAVQVLQRIQ